MLAFGNNIQLFKLISSSGGIGAVRFMQTSVKLGHKRS
jgi:hypothetical protein